MKLALAMGILTASALCAAAEWEQVDIGPAIPGIHCIEADDAHSRVFFGTVRGFRYFDLLSGSHEIREGSDMGYIPYSLETDPNDPLFLLMGWMTNFWSGLISDNYGLVAEGPIVWGGCEGVVYDIERDPTQAGRLFACNGLDICRGKVLRSLDNGATWEIVHAFQDFSSSISATSLRIAANGDILVGFGIPSAPWSDAGILRSQDGGATWQSVSATLPLPAHVGWIEIDPDDPQHWYAAQGGYWQPDDPALGIWETADGGATWIQRLSANVLSLTMHPADASILAVGTSWPSSAILLSRAGGLTWSDVTGNNPAGGGVRLDIAAADNRLYAGQDGYGAWALDLDLTATGRIPPARAALSIHPNPFNPNATITFSLDRPAHVRVAIFDTAGRRIALLAKGNHAAGRHELRWRGLDDSGVQVPSGVYLVQIDGEGIAESAKALLVR